jgi:DNA-binding transcriptional ArsR family regulator
MVGETQTETSRESLEESVFKTLSNQKRRDIIRFLGERTEATFTEIKHSTGEDSPSLSYHLNALQGLTVQNEGRYRLSDLGQEAYKLMTKILTSTSNTSLIWSLRKGIGAMILANAILWAAATVAASAFEGRLSNLTLFSFSILWFVSNIALYSISKRLEWSNTGQQH